VWYPLSTGFYGIAAHDQPQELGDNKNTKKKQQLHNMHTQNKPCMIWRSPLLKVNPVTTDRHCDSLTLSNIETAMALQNKKDCCHTWFTLP